MIFVVMVDCEIGNKGVFEMIRKSIEEGNMDFEIFFFIVLFDFVYVGKSLKVLFSNWWFKLNNECSNIGLFCILWNCFIFDIMFKVRKFILWNDYVKNKDC